MLSRCSNGQRGVTVQNASTASSANVFQYDYTDNAGENDEWYLTPADNRVIGEFRLFVSDHTSTSSSSTLFSGHAFVSVKNTSNFTIPMGALNVPLNTEMSFGTWKGENHHGIMYNLETRIADSELLTFINIKTSLKGSDLADLNNHMATHDFWEWTNNCSYFAISMRGLVSSAPVTFTTLIGDAAIETPYMLKQAVLVCGQPIEYGRILTRVTPIGFVENGVFIDRSAYNPKVQ